MLLSYNVNGGNLALINCARKDWCTKTTVPPESDKSTVPRMVNSFICRQHLLYPSREPLEQFLDRCLSKDKVLVPCEHSTGSKVTTSSSSPQHLRNHSQDLLIKLLWHKSSEYGTGFIFHIPVTATGWMNEDTWWWSRPFVQRCSSTLSHANWPTQRRYTASALQFYHFQLTI